MLSDNKIFTIILFTYLCRRADRARTGNNQERVKIQNTESIKEIIYKYGPISRAEIADMLHLTPPTITTNVANLIQQGMVYECDSEEKKESSVGQNMR